MSNEQRIYDRCIVRVGQLEAENAELREQQAEWRRVAESKQDIIDHMRDANAENAKLRELVGYFLRCERCLCDGCPLNEHGLCSILEKAEELGFEVPE